VSAALVTHPGALYREGFLDAFRGHEPQWLGIDWYRMGFEGGQLAARESEIFPRLGESPDGLERCYLVDGAEVYVRFDERELRWCASVLGRGWHFVISVETALRSIPRETVKAAGRWLSEGRALYGFGRAVVFARKACPCGDGSCMLCDDEGMVPA
jgi:hypothetical protein